MTFHDPSRPEPDILAELRQQDEDQRWEAERRADRIADYTPASLPERTSNPLVTGAMTALAWTVLHEEEHEEAARALAQLVLGPNA